MTIRLTFALCLMLCHAALWAQAPVQVLYLADKGPQPQRSLQYPELLLQPEGRVARLTNRVPLDEQDIPVYGPYLEALQADAAVEVIGQSRWFNAAFVRSALATEALSLRYPFVQRAEVLPQRPLATAAANPPAPLPPVDAGATLDEHQQIGLDYLHASGHNGLGVRVALNDDGYQSVDQLAAFAQMWQGRAGTADFVVGQMGPNFFSGGSHGTRVLSVMAGYEPGRFVGGAWGATYLLARTEAAAFERNAEELYWLQGAEWAEANGARVLNSSLIYNTFEEGQQDYTTADMDGNTAFITRAADAASGRGLLVVNCSGNDRGSTWDNVLAPCDGDSVLCVGGVQEGGGIYRASSFGPTPDGRTKPEVMARGQACSNILSNGNLSASNGTSFAAPLISSLAACLMQAYPQATGWQVRQAIIASADRFAEPDTMYGYGIPDARKAAQQLGPLSAELAAHPVELKLYGNPITDKLELALLGAGYGHVLVVVHGMNGSEVYRGLHRAGTRITLAAGSWPSGLYAVRVEGEAGSWHKPVLKH